MRVATATSICALLVSIAAFVVALDGHRVPSERASGSTPSPTVISAERARIAEIADRLAKLQSRLDEFESRAARDDSDRNIGELAKALASIEKRDSDVERRLEMAERKYNGFEIGYRSNTENLMRIVMDQLDQLRTEIDRKTSR